MFAAAVFVAASTLCAVPEYQKIPQFYKSTDCTGPIDDEPTLWGFPAKFGGTVWPLYGAYMQPWAFEKCMYTEAIYAVKFAVDRTACAGDNAANQVVLEYYKSGRSCSGVPTARVPLTAGKCVRYPLGSVRLTPTLSLPDMCIMTEWAAKMAAGGGMDVGWKGTTNCKGQPAVQINTTGENMCGDEPECVGCCQYYAPVQCQATTNYFREKSACRRSGSTWRYASVGNMYSDNTCTQAFAFPANGVVFELGQCTRVNANGQAMEQRISFIHPMTVDVMCNFVEMTLRNNIASDFVPWDEISNAGATEAPHMAVIMLALVVAVLL